MKEITIKIPIETLREMLVIADSEAGTQQQKPAADPGEDDRYRPRPWTDAQRRMLFRLAYKLGHEGEAAGNFVRASLRVSPGEQPSREDASRLIDRLKNELGNGNGARHAGA